MCSCSVSVWRLMTYWLSVKPMPARYSWPISRHWLVAELFAGRGRQGGVEDGFAQAGPQLADSTELCGQLARILPGHVGVQQDALLGLEVVVERASEAPAF